jgi:hypothetical protein
MHYFSCWGGPSTVSIKTARGHVTPKFCFLHPVGYAGHVVHSGASGRKMSMHTFCCTVGNIWIQQKLHQNTFRQTCDFLSGGIYGSRSAFRWIQGTKRRCTIFYVWVGPVQIEQNHAGTCYVELLLLHSVGSMDHVVHSGASGA